MTQFSFNLIGSPEPMFLDVEASDLCSLAIAMGQSRFISGELVTPVGELLRVLIPVSRIQFVAEVSI